MMYQLFSFSSTTRTNEYLQQNQPLLNHLHMMIKLLNHSDPLISEKAGRCLEILPKVYIINTNISEIILSTENIQQLTAALSNSTSA